MMKFRVLGGLAGLTFAAWSSGVLAANGCASGTYSTTASPDGTSYSTLFSNWLVDASQLLATCSFDIAIENDAAAGNIVVYNSDTRGYHFLEPGDKMKLDIDQGETESTYTKNGPADSDFLVNDLVAVSGDKIEVDGKLKLTAPPASGAFVSVDSLDLTELGRITTPTDQTAAIVHLGATAGLLTGGLQPVEGENEIGLIGGVGSYMLGATGRFNISEGFSVLGGLSLIDQKAGASNTNGVLGAASLRYVEPGVNAFRLMAEGGLVLGGLQTTYPNTTGPTATGLGSVFVRGGLVTDVTPSTQLAVYGTVAETGLSSDAFTQTFTGFTVNVPAQTGFFTTAKATAAVTAELAPTVDLTAEASAGMVMSHSGMTATIPGIGSVSAAQNSGFIDYGLRLGWAPDPVVKLEVFAQGSVGQDVGTHNQIGASAKFRF